MIALLVMGMIGASAPVDGRVRPGLVHAESTEGLDELVARIDAPSVADASTLAELLLGWIDGSIRVTERVGRLASRIHLPAGGRADAWDDLERAGRAVRACAALSAEVLPVLERARSSRDGGAALRDLAAQARPARACAIELATARAGLAAVDGPSPAGIRDYCAQLRVLASDVQVVVELVLRAAAAAGPGELRGASAAR